MLTLRTLVDEMGLELCSGGESADVPLRWVHITESARDRIEFWLALQARELVA